LANITRKKILEKLRNKYRLIIYNDTTFQSVWSLKLTRMKVFSYAILLSATIVISVILLIAATPLKGYIPGFPDARYRQMLIRTALQVDSLENELRMRDQFFESIKAVVKGEIPKDDINRRDSVGNVREVPVDRLNIDSMFQDKILEGQFSLSGSSDRRSGSTDINRLHFYAPLKGIISNRFDVAKDHFGIDVVSNPNARISAALNGTVFFSDYSIETGYTIAIQHDNNIVTVYKHNSELLKAIGNKVKAGEAIAIIGNTGEQTTGPHLHFELWYNGIAIDPLKFIDF
jgi:murein DD-endopeptidase MepM/ murein hydrolase activator NlpD